jgi:hypothetical protein
MRFKTLIAAVFAYVLSTAAHAQTVPSVALPITGGNTGLVVFQGFTCTNGGPAAVASSASAVAAAGCSAGTNVALINLNQFASQGDLSALNGQVATHTSQITTLNGQVTTINGQITTQGGQITALGGQVTSQGATVSALNTQVSAMDSQIASLTQKLSDSTAYVAAVGAMHDAIPDPGDRFAVRLNTAAVNGVVAGGFSASANLGDGFRASINYAGAKSQNAVSAGLNFSFH